LSRLNTIAKKKYLRNANEPKKSQNRSTAKAKAIPWLCTEGSSQATKEAGTALVKVLKRTVRVLFEIKGEE
jgi:hypothetical protein